MTNEELRQSVARRCEKVMNKMKFKITGHKYVNCLKQKVWEKYTNLIIIMF